MADATDSLMTSAQACELYSELMGRPGVVWHTRFNRLLAAGRLGVEGKDWGRFGDKPRSKFWVRESAVRRFAASVKAERDAEVERLGETWSRRAELAAVKAQAYRQLAVGEP